MINLYQFGKNFNIVASLVCLFTYQIVLC